MGIASLMTSSLQECWSISIQSTTRVAVCVSVIGWVPIRCPRLLGIHGSVKARIVIVHPSPKSHIPLFCKISWPANRLEQPHDVLLPFPACRKFVAEKYRPFNSLTHRASDSSIIIAAIFARCALLKDFRSLKSNPPSPFDLVMISHLFLLIFRSPFVVPHQYRAIIALISAH